MEGQRAGRGRVDRAPQPRRTRHRTRPAARRLRPRRSRGPGRSPGPGRSRRPG
jgi:hypothetical protein